jgi:hypothetical protein
MSAAKHLSAEILVGLADRTLAPIAAAAAERHLEVCATCRADLATLVKVEKIPASRAAVAGVALLPKPGDPLPEVQPQDGLPAREGGSFLAAFTPPGLELFIFSQRPDWLLAVYFPDRKLFRGVKLRGLKAERTYSRGWVGSFVADRSAQVEVSYGRKSYRVLLLPTSLGKPKRSPARQKR